ncbi:ABC transporter permease [Myxococcota bacterium]|nr:ABC transporter permease [Myxococcota bacterium]
MIRQSIWMALREILLNPLRSSLTMLGMVIGVASVVALVSLGQGTTAQVTAEISRMGRNLVMVFPGSGPRRAGAVSDAPPFEMADVQALDRVPDVVALAPVSSTSRPIIYGNRNITTQVTGSTEAFLQVREYALDSGRSFEESDLAGARSVCLLGSQTRQDLFGDQDPLGETIRVGRLACEVIGTLAPKGQSSSGMDQDSLVLMPLTTVQRRVVGNTWIGSMFLKVDEDADSSRVIDEVRAILRERRRIQAGAEDNFSVRDTREIAAAFTSASTAMTSLLGAIAAVSLLVGGIGIMNILLVSVTERTREIGLRMALGARSREVLLQFLIESVVISLMGGIIGILLGILGSLAASRFMQIPWIVSPRTLMMAFGVAAAVGVLFGILPARKAARLEPIEALRHE